MPQPKRSSSRRSQGSSGSGGSKRASGGSSRGTRKTSARSSSGGARKSAARSGAGRPSSAKSAPRKSSGQRPAAARKRATGRAGRAGASARASQRGGGLEPALRGGLATIRDVLTRGVLITGERLQETMDDAVRRGRMTRDDAEELVQRLVSLGRRQTEELLSDVEQMLGRGPRGGDMVTAARQAGERARATVESTASRARSAPASDRVLREVDRARRAAGLGQSFPILGYDDLSAAQVTSRLGDLTPAELRKVRDHERRHGNRKSVLDAIESKLA
jgi:polyhydroxyalkanoate synthesis regulator phasin